MTQIQPVRFKLVLLLIAIGFALAATMLVFMVSAAATAIGTSPEFAISIAAGKSAGILGPGEQRWFRVSPDKAADHMQAMSFSMFFTTADGLPRSDVNFELYTAPEISSWWQKGQAKPINFGAGMPVDAPGVGKRIWRGTVLRDGNYYLALENNSNTKIEYWLYNADMAAPEANVSAPAAAVSLPAPVTPTPAPAPQPAAFVVGQGQSPQSAMPVANRRQTGQLAPGQEVWYSFAVDNTPQQFEETALTFIFTPADAAGNVNMDIFTAEAVRTWSPENRAALKNVGAGSLVSRDNNPQTGERFWNGWVVNNELYYVRLTNSSNAPVDYWLFPGDVYQPQLGQ